MTGKILRISYLVAISALLASALLFFGVMYRDYEDGAFARLRAEAAAIMTAPHRRSFWKATRTAKRSITRCKPARHRPRAIPRRFCSARFIMQSFWRTGPFCVFRARRIRSLR